MKCGYKNKKCGLLGEKLGHSFSPLIHGELADYDYRLFEVAPDKVEDFVRNGHLDAFNVTIPYKKTVMPFLDEISPEALAIGAVNTVVRKDGRLYGYNTDYFGFCHMLDRSGINVSGKKVLVFGAGGAAATVCTVLSDKNAAEIVSVSIENNTREFLTSHNDAAVIVNATPVGMYPKTGISPVDLSLFPNCHGVLDVVYNPAKTQLLLDAEARGIPNINGLCMLVAQAARAFEFFTGDICEAGACEKITQKIERMTKNIIIIGMPGCGKTTVGKRIATALDRPFYDADDIFTKTYETTPAEVIMGEGEEIFRQMEHKIACELGKLSGAVISCGGGVVTRDYNYNALHQNATVVFLERKLDKLSKKGRPLSQSKPIKQLYDERIDAYLRFSDITVKSTEIPDKTTELILSTLGF